jgi:hypothetical protein
VSLEVPITAGIFTVLGAALTQAGNWFLWRRDDERTYRTAKADRLADIYLPILDLAWTIHDYTDVGSWQEEIADLGAKIEASKRALLRLVVEGPDDAEKMRTLVKNLTTARAGWRRNTQYILDEQMKPDFVDTQNIRESINEDQNRVYTLTDEIQNIVTTRVEELRRPNGGRR